MTLLALTPLGPKDSPQTRPLLTHRGCLPRAAGAARTTKRSSTEHYAGTSEKFTDNEA